MDSSQDDTISLGHDGAAPPDADAEPSLEQVAADRYGDTAVLSQGGMGRILVARDRRLGRRVALKELRTQSPELRARFAREALLTARLEHPSIVTLHEAGCWPSGEPFYAMRLVPGRPLDRVIGEATTLAARLAILPNVIAVADALAYAHKERVIHRDLKPQNVMVGEFGETVVIDWGLAKDLRDRRVERMPSGVGAASSVETVAGDVLGTPAYMPPEQAAGRPVDERADVYAIGAILYHVLAGAAPYGGARRSSLELIDAVRAGPPPPLATLEPATPPDLLAVVTRAMARDPAARYPTARELADDLRRFQAGQLVGAHRYSTRELVRRWLRRHRAAVAVAAVAAVVVASGAGYGVWRVVGEKRRAEAAFASSEQHRADADELLQFMLVELKERLEPLDQLSLLDVVARKAVDYFARHDAGADPDQVRRSAAMRNLADVLSSQGDAKAALAEYRAALAISEALAARHPDDLERQRDLSYTHGAIGDLLAVLGDTPGALAEQRAALAISESIASRDADAPDTQRDLVAGHERIGTMLSAQGDAAGAQAELRAALRIAADQEALHPDLRWEHTLVLLHEDAGAAYQLAGDTAAALTEFRAALAGAQAITARTPDDAEARRDELACRIQVGDMLWANGDGAGASAQYEAGLALAAPLAAHDPDNASWQRNLAYAHGRMGDVRVAQGDSAGGLAEYRAQLATVQALADRVPANLEVLGDLAVAHSSLGDVLRERGDQDGGLAEHRAALAIDVEIAAKDPGNATRQREVVVCHSRVGDDLLAREDVAGALAEYRAGLAGAEQLAAKAPGDPDPQNILAVMHNSVGDVLGAQGDRPGALAEYRAALAILEALAAQQPDQANPQVNLSYSHDAIGDVLLAQGDAAGALREYEASRTLREGLAARDAANTEWQHALAVSHGKLGDARRVGGDREAALAEYRADEAILDRLVARDPEYGTWRADLAEVRAAIAKLR